VNDSPDENVKEVCLLGGLSVGSGVIERHELIVDRVEEEGGA